MMKIGITGGLGSGKSMVCSVFEWMEIPVFYSDIEVKKLYKLKEVSDLLIKEFGTECYLNNYDINIHYLRTFFKEQHKVEKLTNLILPFLKIEFDNFCELNNDKLYVLYESALIFEYNQQSLFDKIILVTASNDLRIKRVMMRDGITKEKVIERMNLQLPDDYKKLHSNYIIQNHNSDYLIDVCFDIHNKILNINK